MTPKVARTIAEEIGAQLICTPEGGFLFYVAPPVPLPGGIWRKPDLDKLDPDLPIIQPIQLREWQDKAGANVWQMLDIVNRATGHTYGRNEWYGWRNGTREIPKRIRRHCYHMLPPVPSPADPE